MLVLSRKKDERIVITSPTGVVITLTCVEIRGDMARIGIAAPRDWTVHREEIEDRIQRNASA